MALHRAHTSPCPSAASPCSRTCCRKPGPAHLADEAQRVCPRGMLHDKAQEGHAVQRPQHHVCSRHHAGGTRGVEQQGDISKHPPRALRDAQRIALNTDGLARACRRSTCHMQAAPSRSGRRAGKVLSAWFLFGSIAICGCHYHEQVNLGRLHSPRHLAWCRPAASVSPPVILSAEQSRPAAAGSRAVTKCIDLPGLPLLAALPASSALPCLLAGSAVPMMTTSAWPSAR